MSQRLGSIVGIQACNANIWEVGLGRFEFKDRPQKLHKEVLSKKK